MNTLAAVKKKTYHFENKCEVVNFTPLADIFSDEEIDDIISLDVQSHQCHYNSAKVASKFKCYYCEGYLFGGIVEHAFNLIVRNNEQYFFDVTDFANSNNSNIAKQDDAVLVR